jgi:hypothetical protein
MKSPTLKRLPIVGTWLVAFIAGEKLLQIKADAAALGLQYDGIDECFGHTLLHSFRRPELDGCFSSEFSLGPSIAHWHQRAIELKSAED